jgi:hypothetical protein
MIAKLGLVIPNQNPFSLLQRHASFTFESFEAFAGNFFLTAFVDVGIV